MPDKTPGKNTAQTNPIFSNMDTVRFFIYCLKSKSQYNQ